MQQLLLGLIRHGAGLGCCHIPIALIDPIGELAADFISEGYGAHSCTFEWPRSVPARPYRFWRWIRRRSQFTFPWRLAALLRRLRPDVVHTHVTSRIDLQADAIVRRVRLPWVWTLHGLYPAEGAELVSWHKAARMVLESGGRVTVVSRAIAQHWVNLGLAEITMPTVVPVGIEVERLRRADGRSDAWREVHGIPREALLFGTAGRLQAVKGHDVFVEGAGLIAERHRNTHFVIVGDGPLRAPLEGRVKQLGLTQRFHLPGFESDIAAFLHSLDAFVLPSRSEGMPLALIEALAAGLPCIATRVGGVPEVLPEDAGLLVPPESPQALAEAMELMLDPERRRRFASRAREAAERFSIERCAERFAAIYEQVIAARRRTAHPC